MTVGATRRIIFLVAPLAFGVVALALGMDADWDLRNYHYYNAWAFLTDRYDRDVAVAQIPTFYNPILDVPYFLLAQMLPARAVAFLLGMAHGVNFILLAKLADRLLTIASAGRRFALAALLALAGSCGAVALSEVGTVFYDNLLSLGLFASLLIAVDAWDLLSAGSTRQAFVRSVLVGLPAGLAFGVKQTALMFPIGLCLALLLTLPAPPARRLAVAFWCGLGVLATTAIGGGFWMWHLWYLYGNPLFPHFNQVFRSPWALPIPYRDTEYLTGPAWRLAVFPFVFSCDTRQASEIVFQDFRILTAFVLVLLCGLVWLARRVTPARLIACLGGPTFVRPGPAAFLLVAPAVIYLVWLQMFGHYRYLTALEMLAPTLVVAAFGLFPGSASRRLAVAVAVVVLLMATTRTGSWIRVPFSEKAVEVDLPPISQPERTIILLAGHEPLSFLLPSFPPQASFLRIDSTFTNPDQAQVLFNQVMQRRVAMHQGPLLALFIPIERNDVVRRLHAYGLALDDTQCGAVTSPIGAAPYRLCQVDRNR
jgi:hypothetical protein